MITPSLYNIMLDRKLRFCYSQAIARVSQRIRTRNWRYEGDVTRDDSQRRFLAQHSYAMLEQCCNYPKQCRNNVATLCCAKNRRCEPFRVTSPLGQISTVAYFTRFNPRKFYAREQNRGKIKSTEVKREVEQGSTLTFTPDFPYIASILFTRVKFTCVRT